MSEHTYSFGYWLRRRRKALDLTQEALAQSVSCSPSAIRKIETDERRPSKRLAERLAIRLAIPEDARAAFLNAARAVQSPGELAVDLDSIEPATNDASPVTVPPIRDRSEMRKALTGLAGSAFVGRRQEMDALRATLADVMSGHGRLTMLAGEPGIGKTRTAQELATHALERGAQVLWGRCYEGVGAPPYWPWVQAIRTYVQDNDASRVQADIGPGAPDIAEIVPDVRARLPGIEPASLLEPEQARFRLFDSITTFLKSASRHQPLVLILDDLHWADPASLRLLEFVAAEMNTVPLLMIGTYRDMEISRKHPLYHSLAEFTRQGHFSRVSLRGLSRDDVESFIGKMVSDLAMHKALIEAVHRQTEGNPLFVTEVVRLLAQEGALRDGDVERGELASLRIPEGVRAVISRRLEGLSEPCNRCLTIAAVIGRQFTSTQLSRLVDDLSDEQLLEAMEEALAAHVIEELPRTIGHYQFTHALIGGTLAEELSTTRRIRLHARIGHALEGIYGARADEYPAELAHHFSEAATLIGNEKMIHYSLLAGEQALSTYAHEEALAHFERALAAKGGAQMDAETASLLFGIGRAKMATLVRHRFGEAVAQLHRAFDAYVEMGDVARAVNVAEFSFPHFPGVESAMATVISRALALVPPESKQAGRLLSRHVRILGIQHSDYMGAMEASERALAIARRDGDPLLETRTLASVVYVEYFHVRHHETIAKGKRAIELALRTGDVNAEVSSRYFVTSTLRDIGSSDAHAAEAASVLALAEKLRNRFWLAGAIWLNENVTRMRGEWNAARTLSDRGLALLPDDIRLLSTRTMLELEVGDVATARLYLQRLIDIMRSTPRGSTPEHAVTSVVLAIGATLDDAIEDSDLTTEAADTVLLAPSPTPVIALMAHVAMALIAYKRRDARLADNQYRALRDRSGMLALPAGINIDRVLGLLARIMGKPDDAARHFEDALAYCSKAGYRPEYAWSAFQFADALLQRGRTADRARAQSLLNESLSISIDLGMRPLIDRVTDRKKQAEKQRL